VLLELIADQEFLRETTERFLGDQVPVETVRRLRDDPAGFDPDYWRRGAELGWTSLLVGEEHGGGSVSGQGLVDLSLIAYEFGRHAAPGPLVGCNVVAAALAAAGGRKEIVEGLVAGQLVAAWAIEEPGWKPFADRAGVVARLEGEQVVLDGIKRPVESAAQADLLLVTAQSVDGLIQVLVPARASGLSLTSMNSVDLTRRFWVAGFEQVRLPRQAVVGPPGQAAAAVDRQLQLALVVANAESVGAMDRAFDMTVQWAFDRYSFGRPLASYQELKHRFADMKSWLEASHAIADAAAEAVAEESPQAGELAATAKAYIGQYGVELIQDCVQIHGGIGVTFEHDLHLFLRRATLNRSLYGTPAQHRQHLADLAIAEDL
jgi:alkylation response protein AidB-like acyl-CoA dehydrogenase